MVTITEVLAARKAAHEWRVRAESDKETARQQADGGDFVRWEAAYNYADMMAQAADAESQALRCEYEARAHRLIADAARAEAEQIASVYPEVR